MLYKLLVSAILLVGTIQCEARPESPSTDNAAMIGEVIDMHGQVEHLDKLDVFGHQATSGQPAAVRVTRYTIEGDPIYHDIHFANGHYQLRYDTTNDKFGKGEVNTYTCQSFHKLESATEVSYKLDECSNKAKSFEVLTLSYDVSKQDLFELQLSYGVNRKNEINTIERKLVKDLQNGEVAVASDFQLTLEEKQHIYKRMVLANYLGKKNLSLACSQKPHVSYFMKVKINGGERQYEWTECSHNEDEAAMTRLAQEIIALVQQKEIYQKLPAVKGFYE
jgi:hypothetical protein